MIEFDKLTIVIPSLLSNINQIWIDQVNRFNQQKINIIISIPPNISKPNKFITKFEKPILIISSDKKGQVNQRQYAYKFVKTEYLMHMDDDIFITINDLRILLNQFENLPSKSSIAPRLIIENDNSKKLFFKYILKNFLIYNNPKPKSGSLSKSTFEVPHNFSVDSNKEIETVDWIPGGLSIIRKENIIQNEYFIFEGKAYCEDLMYSNLLKNNGIKLFISNKSFYKTELQNFKDLKIQDFIKFIKNDWQARNHFRKEIKNPLGPFFVAYVLLIIYYFLRKIKIEFILFFKKIFF